MALENEYRLSLCVVRDKDKFVLHLVIWVSDTLLLGKEICELLLIVYTVFDLAEFREFSFELFLIHLLVEVLSHDFNELSPSPKDPLSLSIYLLDQLICVVLL